MLVLLYRITSLRFIRRFGEISVCHRQNKSEEPRMIHCEIMNAEQRIHRVYREIGNTLVHQQAKLLKECTYELSRDTGTIVLHFSHTVDL